MAFLYGVPVAWAALAAFCLLAASASAEPGKYQSDDPEVQGVAGRLSGEGVSESIQLGAARELKALAGGRNKEPAVAALVEFSQLHRSQRKNERSKRDADYASDRMELMEALKILAVEMASLAVSQGRKTPPEVGDCLNALIEQIRDSEEPWLSRRKAVEMLARFSADAPAATFSDTRRILEGASASLDQLIETELKAKSWFSSSHPDKSLVETHRNALRAALDALGPV